MVVVFIQILPVDVGALSVSGHYGYRHQYAEEDNYNKEYYQYVCHDFVVCVEFSVVRCPFSVVSFPFWVCRAPHIWNAGS